MIRRLLALFALVVIAIGAPAWVQIANDLRTGRESSTPDLTPTNHPPFPDASEMWLAPEPTSGDVPESYRTFMRAVELHHAGRHAEALALLEPLDLTASPLAGYADFYRGLARLGLQRTTEARATFAALRARAPDGYLSEAAVVAEAEAAEAGEDYASAVALYEPLAARPTVTPDGLLLRLGRAARAAGDRPRAAEAIQRLLAEHPLSDLVPDAARELAGLTDVPPEPMTRRLAGAMARGGRLFAAGRYRDARDVFTGVRSLAAGDDRVTIDLRLAACEFHLGRSVHARQLLTPHLESGPGQAEARYWDLRILGRQRRYADHAQHTRDLVDRFPESPWAAQALDDLATHHIVQDDDDEAVTVFREIVARYPSSRFGDRAAWKAGWWAYRAGESAEAAMYFERAAARHPRSDYRPWFLYWAGRAHERLGALATARERYALVVVDYGSSYYGRRAAERLGRPAFAAEPAVPPLALVRARSVGALASGLPPTTDLIRLLLGVGHFDAAMNEIAYARLAWGDSPALLATEAFIHNRRGELRRAINVMKRAYPQYLTADGDRLPRAILEVLFPLQYWDRIQVHARAKGLDPFVVAALIGQESTFDPTARSPANAYGLMQLVPTTARRLARSAGVQYSRRGLTDPETNIRLGTTYLARLVEQFGDVHLALASYNAGDSRVRRWLPDRGDLDADEFIDDLPFPETQNYVKRVLGTAENYRRLYGDPPLTASTSIP